MISIRIVRQSTTASTNADRPTGSIDALAVPGLAIAGAVTPGVDAPKRAPRLPLLAVVVTLVSLVPSAVAAWILWAAPVSGLTAERAALAARDYTALWGAGHAAAVHAIRTLADPAQFTGTLRALFGPGIPDQIWPYPPTALLLARPLAALPLLPSFLLYTLGIVGLLALSLRSGGLSRIACAAILLSPAVAENALAGQNGSLTAALLVGGLLCIDRRPVAAGILLGMLVVKPQFALLLPFACFASRNWRTAITGCLTAVILSLSSVILFGYEVWAEFLVHAQPNVTAYIEAPWQATPAQLLFTSVFMAARSLGLAASLAHGLQTSIILLCAWLTWRLWRWPSVDPNLRAAATAALTLLAAPWVHFYDMPALASAIVILLPRADRPSRFALGVAWVWPGLACLLPMPPILSVLNIASVAAVSLRQAGLQPRPG